MTSTTAQELTEFRRLSRDIRNATRTLGRREARYLVDTYYQMQDYRIASSNQARSMERDEEPHETISFFGAQMRALENQIKRVLDDWTDTEPLGQWAKSITGIGPVIAAGLLAHIDIHHATTAGKIWRYAGLDPTIEWKSSKECQELVRQAVEYAKVYSQGDLDQMGRAINFDQLEALKFLSEHFGRSVPNLLGLSEVEWDYVITDKGPDDIDVTSFVVNGEVDFPGLAKKLAKRPWNASLKVVCWKLGESFVKVSGNDKDFYGKIYLARKQYEIERNEAVVRTRPVLPLDSSLEGEVGICDFYYTGGNSLAAAEVLRKKNIGKETDAYKAYSIGKLPPAHIHARAKRYAVKMFISHFHEVGRKLNNLPVPAPYVMTHMGHTDYIPPPNFPME